MVANDWREYYVIFCLNIQHLSTGIGYGLPGILIPDIISKRRHNEVYATLQEANWIFATYIALEPISYLILLYSMQKYGQKTTNMLWNVFLSIGSMIIAAAPDVYILLVGCALQALSNGGLFITGITGAEYSHPKRRPIFFIMNDLVVFLGIYLCNSLKAVLTWRQMAWIATIPPIFGLFSTLIWPESPSWLAFKGRFDESTNAFEWLRGKGPEARKELNELIAVQKESRNRKIGRNINRRCVKVFTRISKKFMMPLCITVALILLRKAIELPHKIWYSKRIIKECIGHNYDNYYYDSGLFIFIYQSSSYYLLISACALISVVVVRASNRRTVIGFSALAASVLLGSIYMQMCDIHCWSISPNLFTTYQICCTTCILSINMILKGEIYPLKFKGAALTYIGILHSVLAALDVFFIPKMLNKLDLFEIFGVYLVFVLGLLTILYFILPETKDRTLQDIETEFSDYSVTTENEANENNVDIVSVKSDP